MRTIQLCTMVVIGSVLLVGKGSAQSWRNASRAPVGLAPDPATTVEAVVQVYSARAVSWRGYVGVHSWLAVKPRGAAAVTEPVRPPCDGSSEISLKLRWPDCERASIA